MVEKDTRKINLVLLFIMAMAGNLPLLAQNTSATLGPVFLSLGHDSNFFTGEETLKDSVLLIEPTTLEIARASARSELIFAYRPEFELFNSHPELNAWNHEGQLRFDYRISRRSSFRAGAAAAVTQDPARRSAGSLFIMPRGDYKAAGAYAAFSRHLNRRTTLDARVDNSITRVSLPEALMSGLLDQMSNGATVTLSRALAPRHNISAGYSFVKPALLHRDSEGTEETEALFQPAHNLILSYGYSAAHGLSTHVSTGVMHNIRPAYLLSGQVEKRSRAWRTGLTYSRHLSLLGGLGPGTPDLASTEPLRGLLGNTLVQSVTLSLGATVASKLAVEITARGSKTSSESLEQDFHSVWGKAHLDYRLTDRIVAFLNFEVYGQEVNALLGPSLSRTRSSGGVRVALGRGDRTVFRSDELNTALH